MAGNNVIISSSSNDDAGATAVPVGPTVEVWVTLISCLILYMLSVRSLGRRLSLTHYVLFTNLQALVVADDQSSSSSSSNGTTGHDDAIAPGNDHVEEDDEEFSSMHHHRSTPALNTTTPRKRKHMQQSSSSSHSNMAKDECRRQQRQQVQSPSAKGAAVALFSVRTLPAGSVTLEALQKRESTILWKRLDTAIVFGAVSSVVLCLIRTLRRFCAHHFPYRQYLPLQAFDFHNLLQQEEYDVYQRSFGHVLLGLVFLFSLCHWWKLATLAVGQMPPPMLQSVSSASSPMSPTRERRSRITEPRTYVHAVFLAGVVHWWCSSVPTTTTTLVENAIEELAVRALLWFRLLLGPDVLSRLAVGRVVGSASSDNDSDDNDDNHMRRVLDISVQALRWILILGTAVIAIKALVEPIQTMQIAIAHQYHVGNHLKHVVLPRLVLPVSQSSSSTSTISCKKRLEVNLRDRLFPVLRLVLVMLPPLLYVLSYVWSSRASSIHEDAAEANNSTVAIAFLESSSWRLFAAWLFVVGLAVCIKSLLQDYLFSALLQVAMLQQEQERQQSQRQPSQSDSSLSPTTTCGEIFQRRHRGLLHQASQLTVFPLLMTILCSIAFWSRPIMMDHAQSMVNPITFVGPLLDRQVLQQWWREQQQQQQHLSRDDKGFSWLQAQLFVTRAHPPTVCTRSKEEGGDDDGAGSLGEEEEDTMYSPDQQPGVSIRRPRDLLLRFSSSKVNSDSDSVNNSSNSIHQSSSHPPSILHLLKQLQGLIHASSEDEAIRRALLGLDGDDDDSAHSPEPLPGERDHHPPSQGGPRSKISSTVVETAADVQQVHETKRAIWETWQSLCQHYFFTGRAIFILVDFIIFVVCLYWILTLAYMMLMSRQHSLRALQTRNVAQHFFPLK